MDTPVIELRSPSTRYDRGSIFAMMSSARGSPINGNSAADRKKMGMTRKFMIILEALQVGQHRRDGRAKRGQHDGDQVMYTSPPTMAVVLLGRKPTSTQAIATIGPA